MSIEAMVWVLNHSPLSGADKLVLLGIANHADNEGRNAWPSIATLARYANVTERSAQRAVKRLVDEGHLRVRRQRGGTADTPNDRRPNLYEVVMSGATQVSPRQETIPVVDTSRDDAGVANGVTLVSPEPSYEPSLKDVRSARQPNPLWDAVVDACRYDGQRLTRSEQGRVAKAVSELKQVGATPEDVAVRARAYRKEWPDVELTPQALTSHWSRFADRKAERRRTTCECGQQFDNHDAEVCRAMGGPS